ncbi:MAG: DUF3429 domain-containing protein [Oceanicaulis sp.]
MAGAASKRSDTAAAHTVAHSRSVPVLSLVLGYAAMAPLALAAVAVWLLADMSALITTLAVVWGAMILAFLSGVRRGFSFQTDGGPAVSQLIIMGWLFVLALAAMLAPFQAAALTCLLAGFATLLVVDRRAATSGRQPRFFARLRPPQMGLAVAALASLLGHAVWGG